MPQEELVGTITQYNQQSGVAFISLSDMLIAGQNIHVKGPHDNFFQSVDNLQSAGHHVEVAYPGELVSFPVIQPVETKDQIFINDY